MAKPKIFLADLIHNQRIYNYCVPLNVGCIAAAVDAKFPGQTDLRVFKFPDLLIQALEDGPDVIGLSNYDWNYNLNKLIITLARRKNPNVFIVMGGPNIRRGEKGQLELLTNRPDVDAYVVNEGEDAFCNIVEVLLGASSHLRKAIIENGMVLPQVAYLDAAGGLVSGPPCPSANLSPITYPSAWLTGWMDDFIDVTSFPLSPIIETTRGCPYKCTYCTAWGTAATGTKSIRQFPIEVVFEELKYVFSRSKNPFYLFLGDANIGILERDVAIVEEVRRLADTYGNVVGVGLDSSKNMVKRNIEIYRILGNLCIPTFAQQTFNLEVSEHIGRRNVSLETVQELVSTVHTDGSLISTDLLVGLPTESKAMHIDSVRQAYDCGFDKLQISDIRLLKGTEMEEEHQRQQYGLKEKVRIIPNAFGSYDGHKVIDYEHCIRQTAVMTEADFLELRLFHAHMFIVLNLEIGRPLIDFSSRHGLHAIEVLREMAVDVPQDRYPTLAAYYETYVEQSRSEWFDEEAEANAHYFGDAVFAKLMTNGFPKLNYDFASRLAVDAGLRTEFFAWMTEVVSRHASGVSPALIQEIADFSSRRVLSHPFSETAVGLSLSEDAARELQSHLDQSVPAGAGGVTLSLQVDPQAFDLLRQNLEQFGASNSLYLAVQLVLQYSNKALLRQAKVVSCP